MQSPIKLIKTYASFVKFAHTVFALPFAMVGMIVAYAVPVEVFANRPAHFVAFFTTVLAFVLLCMVGARSFAMGINRIVDRKIDAQNKRTAVRELPCGAMSLTQAYAFILCMGGLYFASCYMLGEVVLYLSPIPIALMALYPFCKRITWLCHLVLGASLGLAPVGAWVAVRSHFHTVRVGEYTESVSTDLSWSAVTEPLPWLLGGAVMFWVAGFDVIYALQDDEFDREHKLHSIPAKFGRTGALWISRGMHVVSAGLFFAFIWLLLNPPVVSGVDTRQFTEIAEWVWAAPCVMLAGMIYQHSLVKPNDLSRVNLAFFTVNGVISVVFGAIFLAAWLA